MNLVRATASIGSLTLVSRFLGMVRDMLMARYVGAGMASDAFLIAWRLPNLFRALFAEGAFAAVFVPMFNRRIAEGDANEPNSGLAAARSFAGAVLSVLFPFLVFFTGVMIALAGPIVWAMTGGFPTGSADKFALAVALTQITFPYLALISLVSLLGGILNSVGRFWVNAAAPILLNVAMIAALLIFRGQSEIETARTQAIAVTVAGALQLIWLIWSCRRAGVVLRLSRPRLTPDVRRMLALIGPAALGQGAIQINLRYDYLDLSDASINGGTQDGYLASLIWTPTAYTRLMLNYGHLVYGDAAIIAAGSDRDYAVDSFGMRAQIDF